MKNLCYIQHYNYTGGRKPIYLSIYQQQPIKLHSQMTVSSGIASKNIPFSKLSCMPLTIALSTSTGLSPASNTTVMVDMTRRQLLPGSQLASMSKMLSMLTGYSSV
mmetsp:Transcript_33446/g.72258  ORF Transcript_33446/g.72258 Transcript_33446/m.72258 type:complete len:106 (-) Transcript_33446:1455-1772(-)